MISPSARQTHKLDKKIGLKKKIQPHNTTIPNDNNKSKNLQLEERSFSCQKLMKTDLENCWWRCNVAEGWGWSSRPLGRRTRWTEWRNRWGCWGKPGRAHSWKRWARPAGTDACWGSLRQTETRPLPRCGTRLGERWGGCGGTTWHGV